ncbi:MAG TPA: formylglycine-generating enzyme family protein [Candidatus Brocadiia bacterium]|nr:formylglycine-generating enzyme family protein [Candidatus Brocadiia bacterium]
MRLIGVNAMSRVMLAWFFFPPLFLVGCQAQRGLMTREHPSGPDDNFRQLCALMGSDSSVGVWDAEKEARFERLSQQAEALNPGGPEVKRLKEEFQQLLVLRRVRRERQRGASKGNLPESFVNSVGITMKLIPPDANAVVGWKPFYIGVYEVTEAQYAAVMGSGGSSSPKNNVSWNEATEFCKKLSQKEGLEYNLPTEAQWEFGCRAGTTTNYSFGDGWNEGASRQANPWGLYDMHGNLWEWCQDSVGSSRVLRGGSWDGFPDYCRSAYRLDLDPSGAYIYFFGFRVVAVLRQ